MARLESVERSIENHGKPFHIPNANAYGIEIQAMPYLEMGYNTDFLFNLEKRLHPEGLVYLIQDISLKLLKIASFMHDQL